MSATVPRTETVEALRLSLHDRRIGVITHYSGGKNILTFDPEYAALPEEIQPVMTLSQRVDRKYFERTLLNAQRLPPVISNLLPEGALREWMVASLKIHSSNEFPLLAWTGSNLPGAIIAAPVPMGEIPEWALSTRDRVEAVQIDVRNAAQKFSLAGVQIKFSTIRKDGRFTIGAEIGGEIGGYSWIIKTPSTIHQNVPANEYSAMTLAQAIGVKIPEIELITLDALDNLPDIQLPDETVAYAIRRFDRGEQGRIHTEDFAQIFELYAHDKYGKRNYEQIAAALYHYGAAGLGDIQQMARRLLANILLANGDAHLKNWTVIYPDAINAELAPAYDIVSTLPYVKGETGLALNLAKQKRWRVMNLETFKTWAQRVGVPWPAVRVHLLDAVSKARDSWPQLLQELPMREAHKEILKEHWSRLSADFRL